MARRIYIDENTFKVSKPGVDCLGADGQSLLLDWNSARINGIYKKGVVGSGQFTETVQPSDTSSSPLYIDYYRSYTVQYGATFDKPRVLFMMVDDAVGNSYAYSNYIISEFIASVDASATPNRGSVYATADVGASQVTFKVYSHETKDLSPKYSRILTFYYIIFYG